MPDASACLTCVASIPGVRSSTSATAPETCAAAYDEPVTKPHDCPGVVAGMSRPGASRAPAGGFSAPSEATAITPGWEAGKPPPVACGSAAATTMIRRARPASRSRPSSRSGGPPKLEVDHLDILLEGKLQRLGERKAGARRSGRVGGLPTCAKRDQFRLRRNTGNADAVIRTRGDDAGDGGAVRLAAGGRRANEIAHHGHAPPQVGMVDFDGGVDLGDPDIAAGCDPVHLGDVPNPSARLKRIQGIVVPQYMKEVHRLRRLDARIARDLVGQGGDGVAGCRLHHDAVDAECGHRPGAHDLEAIAAAQYPRRSASVLPR